MEFEVLHRGGGDGAHRWTAVLRNQQQYAEALARYTAASPRNMDFERNRVLVVAKELGGVGTDVEVESATANANSVKVKVVFSTPQGNCNFLPGVESPAVFVRIPATRTQEVLVDQEHSQTIC